MSKIAIISQPDQGVLIDVSGCTTLKDALDHLSSTLQVSNQFWQGMKVSINLGALAVQKDDLLQILALAKSVGITPAGVYSTSEETVSALKACHIPLASGKPMTLPAVNIDSAKIMTTEVEEERQKANPLATITMRMVDAVTRRNAPKEQPPLPDNDLQDMAREEFEDSKSESLDTLYPHVKPKRKVSLDGRKVQSIDGETPKAAKASKTAEKVEAAAKANRQAEIAAEQEITVKTKDVEVVGRTKAIEAVAPKAEAGEQNVSADQIVSNQQNVVSEQKQFAPAVEMKSVHVPPTVEAIKAAAVMAEPVHSKTIDVSVQTNQTETHSREEQTITGPHVEIKVMTIQAGDGMLEAQPAQKALAQAATMPGDVVTHIDVDCVLEAEVDPTSIQEDDVETTEAFEIEEDIETDTIDAGAAARSGPTTLYIHQNLRSGQTVSHKGHLVIIGDINPGAEVMADGDITVWGCLRGVAHAGIGGNVNAEIRALKLQPIQIRIAHAIARAPDRPRVNYATTNGPETARMVDGKIRVVRSRLD